MRYPTGFFFFFYEEAGTTDSPHTCSPSMWVACPDELRVFGFVLLLLVFFCMFWIYNYIQYVCNQSFIGTWTYPCMCMSLASVPTVLWQRWSRDHMAREAHRIYSLGIFRKCPDSCSDWKTRKRKLRPAGSQILLRDADKAGVQEKTIQTCWGGDEARVPCLPQSLDGIHFLCPCTSLEPTHL